VPNFGFGTLEKVFAISTFNRLSAFFVTLDRDLREWTYGFGVPTSVAPSADSWNWNCMMIRGYRASGENAGLKPSTDNSQLLNGAAPSILILRIAAAAIAGSLVAAVPAHAEGFWSGDDYYYRRYEPAPVPPLYVQRTYHRQTKKQIKPAKAAAKPQGPLIIAISINKQHLKIYDENGLFAETAISTGMRGHATPMGVFSIIQKQKFHESNIYSGAPMPFMQRITWSGIAMHAGVLPGYPASHGCIRMPMAFAVKMYGWTRMGARVIIAPDDMVPESFSHPLLVAQKPVLPQPNVSDKTDKAASNPSTSSQVTSELKATVGHDISLTAATAEAPSPAPLAKQTHTAEATVLPAIKTDVAMSDVPSSAQPLSAGAPEPGASAGAAEPDTQAAQKDQGRISDAETPPALSSATTATASRKHYGPISIFISRKDSKLYVRQDFAPLFDVPVTIAPSDRPLGTHIFTAEADKTDANVLHWSVISLPRRNVRRHDDEHASRRRKAASAAETKPALKPDGPAEALDRITVPADAMTRITEALSNGSSIIVSDQGIAAGETGEGTEFIVSLR
jgi:lipoprotein-anchoring transpeptidase ErfK/SrfK